jgi:ABC-type transporter Mla MlaB component
MLIVNAQRLGSVAIFRCQGRIVSGDDNTALRNAVPPQVSILDLAEVAGIDAGGVGTLLCLRAWTRSNGIQLKIVNVPRTIQQVLEVTHLDRVFEICSEKDLVDLLHRAVGMEPSSRACLDQRRIADREVSATVGRER